MQKIKNCLWFSDQAEEAAQYYTSVFKDSKMGSVSRMPSEVPGQAGKAIVATFVLFGQEFMALNGGPQFSFTEAISLVIDCKDQDEIDYYWNTLTADGGEESMCGWLKDKYGLSWQVVPSALGQLMSGPDKEGNKRVMQALMQMRKLDIAALQAAYDATPVA